MRSEDEGGGRMGLRCLKREMMVGGLTGVHLTWPGCALARPKVKQSLPRQEKDKAKGKCGQYNEDLAAAMR